MELGVIVNFRLNSDEVPSTEALQVESELTKKLATKKDELEVHDGVVYRSGHDSTKKREPNLIVLGCEARAPPDTIYGSPEDEPDETYDSFVERSHERAVMAFDEVQGSSKAKPKKWIEVGTNSVNEAPPLVGAPFDGGVSSPTVVIRENELSEVIRPLPMDKTNECLSDERLENTEISLVDKECSSPEAVVRAEEVRQQLDEVQSENSPEVVCFRPTGIPVETKLSEVVRFRPDVLTEETKPLSFDDVSDEADRAEKSLSECSLDKAKSSDDNVSNGANEPVDVGIYEADETLFEQRRPARQHKRPSKYEDIETQFATRRMRASRRKIIEFSPSYNSSRVLARGSIQHSLSLRIAK